MTFFYDLNKRLASLADKQDLYESKVAESEKWIQKAVNPAHKGGLHKALHVAQGEKIPKAKINKATHSKNPKLRHMAQFAKNVAMEGTCSSCGCSPCECVEEGNAFSGALANAKKNHKSEFEVDGKKYKVTEADPMGLEESHCPTCDCAPCECNEGAGVMHFKDQKAKEAGKKTFKLGDKTFPVKEKKEPKSKGTAFDPEVAKSMFADKDKHPRHDVKDTGYSKRYTRKHEDDVEKDDEVKSDAPKKKGRPKGPAKGPERTTKHAYKHKGERKVKEDGIPVTDRGEYDNEGSEVKGDMHTVIRHATELERHLRDQENLPTWVIEKIGQIKGMMTSVSDYILSQHERGVEQASGEEGIRIAEKITKNTPTGDVIHDFVHSKNPKFAGKSKKERINQALGATYAMKKGKMEEESTDTRDTHAEKAGKRVTKDLEYDMKHKGKDDAKAEKAGKRVTKDIEYDEKVKESSDEAPAKKSSKGMQFGKGVYESIDREIEALVESMNVSVNMSTDQNGEPHKNITVSADGEDADVLAQLLKAAGIDHQGGEGCSTCGSTPCGCDQQVDENSPDWPTNTETLAADPNLRTYSGGLNGPKSTGQSTTPVLASQMRRQASMEESVELERSLFKTWKNYKG